MYVFVTQCADNGQWHEIWNMLEIVYFENLCNAMHCKKKTNLNDRWSVNLKCLLVESKLNILIVYVGTMFSIVLLLRQTNI